MAIKLYRQQGVALIQVLLISTIIMVLALQISHQAKNQVRLAQGYQDKIQAELKLYSAEKRVLFELLTRTAKNQPQGDYQEEDFSYASMSDTDIPLSWNFYGEPFTVNGVTIKLQDINGLVSSSSTTTSLQTKYLLTHGYPESLSETFEKTLYNWQHPIEDWQFGGVTQLDFETLNIVPRLSPLQLKSEYRDIINATLSGTLGQYPKLHEAFECCFTLYSTSYINLMNAPQQVLQAYIEPSYLAALTERRHQGDLDQFEFRRLAGLTGNEEQFGYSASSTTQVKLRVQVGNIVRRVTLDVRLLSNGQSHVYEIRHRS